MTAVMQKRMHSMFIKGKDRFNPGLIYQGKAGAVRIAQPFIVNLSENSLCGVFNIFSNTKDSNVALVHLIHELDGCGMAASHLEKCIGFVQDIIRRADKNLRQPLRTGIYHGERQDRYRNNLLQCQ